MYRDGIGVLDIVKSGKVAGRVAVVVKAEANRLIFGIDAFDKADIAVENAAAFAAVGGVPFDIVIVVDLHDFIAFAKDRVMGGIFFFLRRRRIEQLPHEGVDRTGSGLSLARRADDLNVGKRVEAIRFRQTRAAQLGK